MTIDKEARNAAADALIAANKAKKGIKDRQVKNISVASQSAMLALTDVLPGQIVIREDDGYYNYLLKALPASNLSNWQPMGKDVPPIGETVEDIITTNEVITSKTDGLYAFTGTPNGGFPAGVTQGDIAQKTGSVWTVVYTFINAPASIYAKSDGQTYDKKVNSSNVNNWVAKQKPAYYEIGSNKEFSVINNVFAQFITDGVSVGVGQLYDSEFNQRVIFPANAQNFLLKGEGYVTRNNNLVNNIEILGHRFTLQKCQPSCDVSLANVSKTVTTTLNSKTIVITGAGQTTSGLVKYQKITGTGIPAMSYIDTIIDSTTFTISQNATANGTNITTTIQPKAPIVIDSSGTITEAGQPNIKRGKHCFDDLSFSTPGASAIDIFDIGHFADFRNCNFANKEINLYTTSTTPVYITFTNCQAGVINIYSPFIVVTKAYSPSVVFKTIISQVAIVDFDKATPVAYSLLRQYSLGQTVSVPLGAMIINDDVGGTLQMLKCTTAYTIPVTINTGTPIDLTKYQVETDNLKQNITDKITTWGTPTDTQYASAKLTKDTLDLKPDLHKALQVTSSATNLILTKDIADSINITGTATQTVVLPDATTLSLNWYRRIYNTSSQTVTVLLNDGTTQLTTINAGQWIELYATSITNANGAFLIQSRNFTDASAGLSSGGFYGKVIHSNSTNLSGITDEQTITFNTLNYATAGNTDFISHNGGSVFTLQPGFHYFIQWQSASYNAQGFAALNIDGVDVSGLAGTISNTLTPTKIGNYALTIPVGANAKQIKLTAELGSGTTPLSIHEPMLEVTAFKIGTIPPVSADPYLQIGGNATGTKLLSGTNDNQDYFFKTNGVERGGFTRFGNFVLPSLTSAERNALINPANGSVIYNTTTGNVEFRQNGTWIPQFVAYVNFRGDSTPILVRQSYNIASVVRNATGDFTINLSNGVTNVDRVFIACVAHNSTDIPLICRYNSATSSTTALDVKFVMTSVTSASNPLYAHILIFNL